MLPERSAESFRAWLDAHPGVEIICRDRAGCYAEGASQGAPLATQVADRWHLWHNLAEAVERAVARHRACLQEPAPDPEPAPPAAQAAPAPETGIAARTRTRHADIHAALARGLTLTEISRALRLDPKTVHRYATAATAGELTGGPRLTRPGLLGPHQDWLRQRWDQGVRSTERLHAELRDRGYRGSLRTLRRLTAQLRKDTAIPAPPPALPAKQVARWILTPPGDLTDDDRAALTQITARCAELHATRDLVRDFADMLCHRRGEHLPAWTRQAETSPVSELRGFAKRTPQRLGRRHRRAHRLLQLRRRRRPRQPHQDDQKTDVRPRETRPAPQTRPARRLTLITKLGPEPSTLPGRSRRPPSTLPISRSLRYAQTVPNSPIGTET
jgi:hypothetical protein